MTLITIVIIPRADHWKDLGRNGLQLPTGEEQERRPGADIVNIVSRWIFLFRMTMMVGTMTQCRDDGGNGDGDDDDDIVNIVLR